VTFTINANPGDRLSFAGMLICTNDGFTGLDSLRLPNNNRARVTNARGYDAGSEITPSGAPTSSIHARRWDQSRWMGIPTATTTTPSTLTVSSPAIAGLLANRTSSLLTIGEVGSSGSKCR